MTQQNLDDLTDLYKATGLPFVVVDQEGEELTAFPYAFEGTYQRDFLKKIVFLLEELRPFGVLLQATTDFYYLAVTAIGEKKYLVSAPISNIADNKNVISPVFADWVNRERLLEFVHMVASIPGMNNFQLSKIAALAKRLCSGTSSDGTSIHHVGGKEVEVTVQTKADPFSYEERERNRHQTVDFEDALFNAIEAGDKEQLSYAESRTVYGVIGRMSMNSLRQAKYLFVSCIYAASRAAIRGSVPSEHSFQLSDAYCQRMDGLMTVSEVNHLRSEMLIEYCNLVRQYQSKKNYCYTTRQCCEYIREHMYDEITIEELTKLAHLNRRSLSIYFKQDTGKGIPEYINDARLEEARFLLLQTEMPLAEISELLHFCNQSYFCRKFREKYGTSPNALRKT